MKHRALKLISFILLAAMLAAVLPLGALAGHVELSSYEYGTAEYYSYVSGRFISDRYYYSDLFFSGDPAEKNDELALISARLSSASTDDTHGAALLKKLGFSDVAVKKYQSENADDCAYTTGRKTISIDGTEYTLIAVSVQSSEYGLKGWLQNVSVNNAASADSSAWTKTDGQGGDHAAYRIAAESITADLSAGDIDEKTIIWICGQSRGGGIANLAAAYIARGLKTKDGIASPVVFAYTFEAPATTSNTEDAADAVYACIHNYVCDDDIVTMVPMWGMVRYGTDVIYNTADVADVIAALVKQNPDAEAYTREYDVDTLDGDVKAFAEDILAKLLLSVPTRGDYSAPKSDSFTQDGKKTEIEYCYQNGLRALCTVVSGGEGDVSENLSSVFENREAAPLITYGYMEEVYANEKNPENKDELLSDAAKKRWEAAGILYDAACAQMTPDFDRSDMYALVKLAGPLLINTKKVTGEGAELPVYDDEFAEKGYRGYFNLA
ncbi:MAG: hypothetical protein IKD89_02565 [Clostridia bacterium]|nr:hypothetical protein [Clostridia bacterium]